MRRVKIRTVEDMMALPQGEWVEVPDGLDLEVVYEGTVKVEKDKLTVEVPGGAAKELRPWTGGPLTAKLSQGRLIIERRARKRRQRRRTRARS
ncbi:MAG TPA: hypothetical protein VGB42_11940 [Candidatus Thermoplasmatota archaeon]